jgi:hypothetical protein
MWFEFLLFIAPGSALMVVILRFIKQKSHVSVARTDAARATARMEAAQQASAVARETAREAMGQVSEALSVARTIGIVDAKIDYIVAAINGEAHPAQREVKGRHKRELPSGD